MIHRIKYHYVFSLILTAALIFGGSTNVTRTAATEMPGTVMPEAPMVEEPAQQVEEWAPDTTVTDWAIRNAVVASARRFVGVRYRRGGNGQRGFDCSGFVHRVLSDHGFKSPRTSIGFYQTGKKISMTQAAEGDIVFFRTCRSRISHVGIYLGNGRFIHSASRVGVRVDNLSDRYYRRCFAGAASLFSYPVN